MKNYKLFAIAVLVILAYLLQASMSSTPSSSLSYNLKRAQEKIFLKFRSTPESKARYLLSLLDSRATEINSLVKEGRSDFLWSESLRYASHLGNLTDLIKENNLTDIQKELELKLNQHKELFNNLVVQVSTADGREDYKFLQDAINYININLERLK